MYSEDIQKEFTQNFLDYAASVNWDRAIPRAQDGLKPVARRILWGMYEGKYFSNKPEMKSARIVGDVMGKYHPHGDSSIYEAMIRLSKPWIMRYPLIDVHGNKGNVGGDGPAAMRYTESRLTKLIEDSSLGNLNKDVVPMMNNYDDTLQEPEVLPSIFPNLLCSPNQGIGVAQACYWLPHNLNDIAGKINKYIETGEVDCKDLYPDFPLGGTIVNPQEVSKIYETGKGKVIVEGKYKIEGNQIIFYEQPYEVATEALVQKLKDQYEAGKLTQIADFQDQSGKKGFRLVFDLVPNADKELALTEIFSFSDLRKSYSANCVAIRDLKVGPELLTLKDAIECYVEHNSTCIQNEFKYDFGKTCTRIEILEGLLIAIANIDKVIKIIRETSTPAEELKKTFPDLTELQIKSILDMKLGRLSKLENEKIEKELQEKKEYAAYCKKVMESVEEQKKILAERLQELVKKYGDERRTEVTQREIKKIAASAGGRAKADVPQDVVVTFDRLGYIKMVPVAQYKRGKSELVEEFKTSTDQLVLLFSSLGKCYRINAKDVGISENKAKGKIIGALLDLEKGETIVKVLPNRVDEKKPYVTIVTNDGKIKKTEMTKLIGTTRNLRGVKYIGLDGNEVFYVAQTNGDFITLMSSDGYALSFQLEDFRATGPASKGVIGQKLNPGVTIKSCALNELAKGGKIAKRAGKGTKVK